MLEPLSPCGGVPESLVSREVASVNGKCRYLTTVQPLPTVVFPASVVWVTLSAPQGGMLELLGPY
jgi:hypothetical protein